MAATVTNIQSSYASIADVYFAIRGEALEGTDDEVRGWCLVPAHNDTGHPSASYNTVKNVWQCFSCEESGGVNDLLLASGEVKDKKGCRAWLKSHELIEDQPETSTWDQATVLYNYTDAEGALKYQVGRWNLPGGGKEFKQRAVKGDGSFDSGKGAMKDVVRVPYRLPLLLSAAEKGLPAYVVEGEKDADSLKRRGFISTTNSGGSKFSWPTSWADYFKGIQTVYVLADNDEPGRKCAESRAKLIATVVPNVFVVYALPGVGDKGDITDWLELGGTREQLEAICEAGTRVTPYVPSYDLTAVAALQNDQTEFGAADWTTHHIKDRVRYVGDAKQWFGYKDGCWEQSETQVRQLTRNALALMQDAARDLGDEKMLVFADYFRTFSRVKNVMGLCQSENVATMNDFDRHPALLNVANGTIDLDTKSIRDFDPADFITRKSPVTFDPSATCPKFEAWLRQCVQDDEDLFRYMQQVLGTCLEARAGTRKFFFIFGPKGTGKSTFLHIIEALLGPYQSNTEFSALAEATYQESGSSHSTHIARLKGLRMVSAVEAKSSTRLDCGRIKQLIGGDMITARHLNASAFTFRFEATLILSGNELPKIIGDTSIWDKFCPVPFLHELGASEDPNFERRELLPEISGILNFALAGLQQVHENGGRISDPPVVNKYRVEQMKEQDTIGQFVTECITLSGMAKTTRQSSVQKDYADWCQAFRFTRGSKNALTKAISALGGEAGTTNGVATWKNVVVTLESDGQSRFGEDP